MANTIYLLAGSVVANLTLFISNLLMARIFDPTNYGIITIVVSINSFFLLIADMGVAMAVTKFIAEDTQDQERISRLVSSALKLTVGFSLVAMVLLVSLSAWLAKAVFHQEIGLLLRVSAVWIASSLFFRVCTGVFNGFQRMGFSFVNSILFNGLRFIALITVICLDLGIDGVVAGWSFAYLVSLFLMILLFLFFLRKWGIKLQWTSGHERRIFKYGMYLALPFLGIYLIPYLLNIIIGWLSTADDVGYLAISFSLASLSFLVLTPVSNVLLPIASEAFASDDWERVSTIGKLNFKYLWLLSFGVLAFLSFFGEKLITLLYGAEYVGTVDALVIIAFAVFFESVKATTDPLLNGTKYARTVTRIEILKFALIVGLGIGLVYVRGVTGAATAIVIAYFVSAALKMYQVQKRLNVSLVGIAVEFVPLVLALVLFIYLGLPAWLFVILTVVIIVYRRLVPVRELQMMFSFFRAVMNYRDSRCLETWSTNWR